MELCSHLVVAGAQLDSVAVLPVTGVVAAVMAVVVVAARPVRPGLAEGEGEGECESGQTGHGRRRQAGTEPAPVRNPPLY